MTKKAFLIIVGLIGLSASLLSAKTVELLNVSYDPTREFYEEYNKAFAAYWAKQGGGDIVTVSQSHGGSGKQARAVIDGLQADVVTLALSADIDAIAKAKLIAPEWEQNFPDNSSPYTSTIVLVVRKGNPKGIKDWNDLIKPGVEVVTANPKTGGGARWNYLAAYGYALNTNGGDEAKATAFIKALYGNVKILDSGARGSTITFVERGQGDVLIAWENEALLTVNKLSPGQFEIVYPSQSILAEPPVAVVDANVDKHGTRDVATAYLKYLYTPEGQEIAAHNFYRPRDTGLLAKYATQFPSVKLFTIKDLFGGWPAAQKKHFSDGGIFDQIYGKPVPPAK
jgi:sulfate/thiosulfate transport system substrate-binding protein